MGDHPSLFLQTIILVTCNGEKVGKGKRRKVGVREFEFKDEWPVACLLPHTTN